MPQLVVPIMILGTLASAGSQIHSGMQQKKQARKNEKRLKRQGDEAYALRKRRSKFVLAQQRSMFSAGGVSLTSPSAVDVLAATAAFEERAAQRARDPYRADASAQGEYGSQAYGASLIGAGGTILSGASAVAAYKA